MNNDALKNMEKALNTFKERNAIYGDSYLAHGSIMQSLFPDGVTLKTQSDFNRYSLINTIVAKMMRYVNCFESGGHTDSAHDMIVYSAMLEELTVEKK